jgi:hypothetical protein
MRRRAFISLLGGGGRVAARGARTAAGDAHAGSSDAPLAAAFRKGLNEAGLMTGEDRLGTDSLPDCIQQYHLQRAAVDGILRPAKAGPEPARVFHNLLTA